MLRVLQKKFTGDLRVLLSRSLATGVVDSPHFDQADDDTATTLKRRAERGLNRVTLIGRVGRDPDIRGTEHTALIFPLATNFTFKKSTGELLTKTDWHRICIFKPGMRDALTNRIKKGDRLFVEGSLSYVKYTDDDKTTTVTSIIADEIMFLTRQQNSQADEDDS